MTEREAVRTFALAYLRRLAHLGGAEALAAALPTTADAMVADGLAPRRHVGAECWALTVEADGRVVLTWPDGAGERLDLPPVPAPAEARHNLAVHLAERRTADPTDPRGGDL